MAPTKKLTLLTIYDPEEAGNGPATVDIVLVHGLNGDPVESFTHKKTGVFWAKDLLPKKLPHARVLSFGYNADIVGNTSTAGIRGNARALLARLRDEREDCEGSRAIVFLAHSLGGLIVKQAVHVANMEPEYDSISTATRGFLFYGTPHAGADRERWLSLCKKSGALMQTLKGQTNPLVDALARNSRDITNLCEDFRTLAQRYAIFSFYETRVLPGATELVVEQMSSWLNLHHEDLVPLDANHLELCRFEDEKDDGFTTTLARIKRAIKGTAVPRSAWLAYESNRLTECLPLLLERQADTYQQQLSLMEILQR